MIMDIGVSNLTSQELNEAIYNFILRRQKSWVLNVNIHAMNLAHEFYWFKDMLSSAPIVFCDGDGVRLGAKLLGIHIKEKITYNQWIWIFAKWSEDRAISWYLIGSTDVAINKSVMKLKSLYPSLNIKGYRNGFFKSQEDVQSTREDINLKKPDVLILGMGMPAQESWLIHNWDQVDAIVALTGGAVFDYISGKAKMTPAIFYQLKLEWFYRFLHEPKRLFKRYFIGNFSFMYRILTFKVKRLIN